MAHLIIKKKKGHMVKNKLYVKLVIISFQLSSLIAESCSNDS